MLAVVWVPVVWLALSGIFSPLLSPLTSSDLLSQIIHPSFDRDCCATVNKAFYPFESCFQRELVLTGSVSYGRR